MAIIATGTVATAVAAPRPRPCAEIRAACEQAGFVRGGAKSGEGVVVDCVAPIMQGIPQRRRASKPLPQIDPQLVADCKTRNPNFGQRRTPPANQAQPAAPPAEAPPPTSPTPEGASPVPPAGGAPE